MSSWTRILFAGTSILAYSAAPALAVSTKTVPTVVVSPTRSPTPIDQVASSITVITREDIERKRKSDVVSLLREAPGVAVAQNGSAGQTARIFLRGANSNHTLVMIDGVRVNDPSDTGNAFDFSNLNLDSIERIEILRGPQSPLYGSSAIGGVINIITRKGEGAPRTTAFAEYGRYNSKRLGVGNSGQVGDTSYNLSANYNHSNGISSFDKKFGGKEKDSNKGYGVSGTFSHAVTDQLTAKFAAGYNRNDTAFDNIGAFPITLSDSVIPQNDSRQFNARAAGELSLFDGQWVQELGVGMLDVSRFVASTFQYQHYNSDRRSIDWVHRLNVIPQHEITMGGELWQDSYRALTDPARAVNNKAVFLNDKYSLSEDWFVHGGLRLDHHEIFGSEVTWKAGTSYRIASTGTTLKGTYGTGFNAPSLYNLYSAFFGDPTLQPETSKGYDIGFEQDLWDDRVSFGARWFHNDIEQLIDVIQTIPFDPFSYRYVNVGKARTQGVESTFAYRPTVDWLLTANYTYMLADDVLNDISLVRRPKHQANMEAAYQYSMEGNVSANLHVMGSREDYDFSFTRTRLPNYATVGIATSYDVDPQVTVYGRVDNLLNKRHQEVYGYGTPGMSLYAGVKTRF